MIKNQQAFTLIELLVVVLIIGILASVALPQYKKAVAKARLATIKPIMASLKNAEEAYYLANNTYTSDGSNLDIESSCEATNDPGVFICGKYFVVDLISGNLTPDSSEITAYYCPGHTNPWATCTTTYKDLIYHVWLSQSSYPDTIQCTPYTATGTALCKVMQ
jgi:prepilin-type N-terminal cleavage/methylation domain-containing protein